MKVKNRWLIALCAVGLHISIGSVYAWSNFTDPLLEIGQGQGWTNANVQLTFSIAILFLGLSAAFLGHFVEKHGPRKTGLIAATFFGIGIFTTGFAVKMESLTMIYLTYGVLGGIGLGTGYIAPVSTLVKWFPDRRGLATGLAIMGFGFAAAVASPIMDYLNGTVGVANTFFILGASYFVVMFLSSLYLEKPPEGWAPASFEADAGSGEKVSKQPEDLSQLTANEAIKTKRFYYMWFMLFINITCGIAVTSAAKVLAVDDFGMAVAVAATFVGAMGVMNGGGRIGWATASDYLGRMNTWTIFFVLQIFLFFLLPKVSGVMAFVIISAVIYSCYGGGFAAIPAFIGDVFGTKQLGAIHGYILTAWSAGGLAGPLFAAYMKDVTGSYANSLIYFSGLMVVAFFVSILMRMEMNKLRRQNELKKKSAENSFEGAKAI
ncbi:MFS transporter [Ammoniphilus oxalaticus]|uniref:MFS transporter n=2 Tax=Ammoniphilus oxalaticus TaxID=66863 RepID=A0A419SDJ3_9BACL|nr:MFS transporter [Ammoniphilus oxalaticus]